VTRDDTLYYVLNLPATRDPLTLARAAVAGGAGVLQLRGKDARAADLYHLAVALKECLTPVGVPLIINDRLDVALAAGADGVHVGGDDLPCARVRELAPDMILGVSCYGDLTRAARAAAAGADYLAFGAFHPSPRKPDAPVVPRAVLSEARRFGLPVVAIGGVTRATVAELIRAGADGVAVISAIQDADDAERAARELTEAVAAAQAHRAGTGQVRENV